jgi:hypothetical protein
VIFSNRPLLKQQSATAVENKDTESPVQESLLMGSHFLTGTDRLVRFVHEYDLFQFH